MFSRSLSCARTASGFPHVAAPCVPPWTQRFRQGLWLLIRTTLLSNGRGGCACRTGLLWASLRGSERQQAQSAEAEGCSLGSALSRPWSPKTEGLPWPQKHLSFLLQIVESGSGEGGQGTPLPRVASGGAG